ncbi:DUF421 domain-containing protein [Roseobacter ponti]|uniref:DUF421 domain-containing protein n=1 Tax=Roseobacter ponti TaxID=1891787 RepID=A0A858SR91_9RHOB|nr:YetF domain-containing protein [Roseobacter ponti]QJF50517.1 DUF421 domain-containing protein [Roseobacter ponti]
MTFLPDDLSSLWQAIAGGILAYCGIILAVRIAGLRSFAKMASHDFAVTVAVGSLLASAATSDNTPLAVPLAAIAVLFVLQMAMTGLVSRSDRVAELVTNKPLLLMDGRAVLHDNLRHAKVSEDELRAKLREANVTDHNQVLAVVFETTGDISVLHGSADAQLDPDLLKGVARTAT